MLPNVCYKILGGINHICNFVVIWDKYELIRFSGQKVKGQSHYQSQCGPKRALPSFESILSFVLLHANDFQLFPHF